MALHILLLVLGLILQGWVSCALVAGQPALIRYRELGNTRWLWVPSSVSIALTATGAMTLARSLSISDYVGAVAGPLAWQVARFVPVWWHNRRVDSARHPASRTATPSKTRKPVRTPAPR